jgi:hypothetical protein
MILVREVARDLIDSACTGSTSMFITCEIIYDQAISVSGLGLVALVDGHFPIEIVPYDNIRVESSGND